jgi:hypothetical protein
MVEQLRVYTFRRGKDTTDLIFRIRQLIEKYWEYEKQLVMIFIDYKKHLIPSEEKKFGKV